MNIISNVCVIMSELVGPEKPNRVSMNAELPIQGRVAVHVFLIHDGQGRENVGLHFFLGVTVPGVLLGMWWSGS